MEQPNQPDPTAPHDEEDVARILANDSTSHGPGNLDAIAESDTDLEVEE